MLWADYAATFLPAHDEQVVLKALATYADNYGICKAVDIKQLAKTEIIEANNLSSARIIWSLISLATNRSLIITTEPCNRRAYNQSKDFYLPLTKYVR